MKKSKPYPPPSAWAARLLGVVLLPIGGYLAWQGGVLSALGGSWYYLLCGLAVLASAVLLLLRRIEGVQLYAAMLVATVGWALWEVGTDGWRLMPRLVGPLVLGALLLPPFVRRPLEGPERPGWRALITGLVLAVVVGLGLHAARPAPIDPIYQRGVAAVSTPRPAQAQAGRTDWPAWGRDAGGQRFSPLTQITPANVAKLEVAWTFHAGPSPQGMKATMESVPLMVGETLYVCTSVNQVIAIDARSGRERWRFDPHVNWRPAGRAVCRGVAYYEAPGAVGPCARRIIGGTIDARLFALDAASGRLCAGFGEAGFVNLLAGMGDVRPAYYYVSSAPTIVRGRIVVGGWVADGQYWGEPSGVIRAFDAATGKFAWAFDVGRLDRQSEPPAGESYTRSTPNSWAPMSADEALGLVYAPTGNSTPDYFGAQRRAFDDRFSSAVVAIDAETGRLRWVFQTTHHDVWDYDVASQPALVDLPRPDGGVQHALLQATKRGELFMLDRTTGAPIAEVSEVRAPARGAAAGERLAPTQPFSTGMPSFRGADLRERDMWGVTPLDQLWCRVKFRQARYDGPLTPPGLSPFIEYPGFLGGMNWGGVAVDPERLLLTVNVNHVANYDRLISRAEADRRGLKPTMDVSHDVGGPAPQTNTPYAAWIQPFLSPLAVPCQAPPFGRISAVDLRTRKLVWTQPMGRGDKNGPFGLGTGLRFTLGTPNLGGGMMTRSGLLFIGAATDRRLRAYDAATGKLLWEHPLPAGGNSIPISYLAPDGRQMVVISASGTTGFGAGLSDAIVAFALPEAPQAGLAVARTQ